MGAERANHEIASVIPVKSSGLKAIDHDPATKTLTVEFASGARYHYAGVSAQEHAKLMQAESKGAHFAAHIRDKFKAVRAKA